MPVYVAAFALPRSVIDHARPTPGGRDDSLTLIARLRYANLDLRVTPHFSGLFYGS